MIIVDMWKINRTRCKGRFNLYFCWLYLPIIPACLVWDALCWLETKLT